MAQRSAHRLPTLGALALSVALLLPLAACGSGAVASGTSSTTSHVVSQARARTVTTAIPTAPGSIAGSLAAAAMNAQDGPLTFNADYVSAIIAITNQERAANGCGPLIANPILMGTAQAHSNDMALNHFFAHTSSTGLTPAQRMTAAGYQFSIQAENIAAGYATPDSVMSAWFNESPPNDWHRRNILDCRLHEIGVGYCYLASDPNAIAYHSYWTEDFGTPA